MGRPAEPGHRRALVTARLRSAFDRTAAILPGVKALVKARAEPGLWLEDVPDPVPGRGEVLIRVLRTGICGTDLHIES